MHSRNKELKQKLLNAQKKVPEDAPLHTPLSLPETLSGILALIVMTVLMAVGIIGVCAGMLYLTMACFGVFLELL